jgi:hypothetical protein
MKLAEESPPRDIYDAKQLTDTEETFSSNTKESKKITTSKKLK